MRARNEPQLTAEPILLDVKDVQEVLRVGRQTALTLMHRAGPVYVGRNLRVRLEDLRRLVSDLREEAAMP